MAGGGVYQGGWHDPSKIEGVYTNGGWTLNPSRIEVYQDGGWHVLYDPATVTAPTTAPSSVSAIAGPSPQVSISWTNTNTTDGLEIEWYQNGSLFATSAASAGATNANYGGFTPGASVFAKVRYTNTAGSGPQATSNTVTVN